IARAFTGQPLLVATGRHLAPLAARIVPSVQVLDTTGLHGRLDPGTPVGTAIDLHGSGPESHRLLLGTRPECLVAFRHPTVWDTPDAPVWNTDEHEVIRWARLLDSVG